MPDDRRVGAGAARAAAGARTRSPTSSRRLDRDEREQHDDLGGQVGARARTPTARLAHGDRASP